jgi:hypothetical protein
MSFRVIAKNLENMTAIYSLFLACWRLLYAFLV